MLQLILILIDKKLGNGSSMIFDIGWRITRKSFDSQQKGFEHVLELAVKVVDQGYNVDEIAVEFEPRQTGTSKMRHVSETLKYFYLLMRYAMQSSNSGNKGDNG